MSDDAMVNIKEDHLKLLIEMSCRGRALAWTVKNHQDTLKDGIAVGEAISEVLSCEDDLNEILNENPNMHQYD